MVSSEFNGEQENIHPAPTSGENTARSAHSDSNTAFPATLSTHHTPLSSSPAPAERPFLLPDDVDTPAPFPPSFEYAFPDSHTSAAPPLFANPYQHPHTDSSASGTAYPTAHPRGTSGTSGAPYDPTASTTYSAQLASSATSPASGTVNEVRMLQQKKAVPRFGWRKFIYTITRGAINPGLSSQEKELAALEERVCQPVRGDYRIACLSLKGGVGKTTTTIGLGSTFASLRGDRIIAIDANPDLGTLAQRVPQQTQSTVRDLLEDNTINRYSDVRAHTSQARSRLEVLASESDPAISEAFSEQDYRRTIDILQSFYTIILTDCGTGLMHDAMRGILDLADSLVLVSSPAIDGARSAWATLNWLDAHGYQHLVERTVVAICASRTGSTSVDMEQLRATFSQRCAAVHLIPFDEHLAEGSEVDMNQMGRGTRRAFLELAASVADGFSQTLVPSSVNRQDKHHPRG